MVADETDCASASRQRHEARRLARLRRLVDQQVLEPGGLERQGPCSAARRTDDLQRADV